MLVKRFGHFSRFLLLFFKLYFRCEKMWLNKKNFLTETLGLNFYLKKEPEKLVYSFA